MKTVDKYEKKESPVECVRTGNLSSSAHLHAEWEMVYCMDGETDFWIGDVRSHAKTGDLILVPPYYLHCYRATPGRFLVMIFTPETVPGRTETLRLCRPDERMISCGDDPALTETLHAFETAVESAVGGQDGIIDNDLYAGYLNLLFYHCFSRFRFSDTEQCETALVQQIMEFCSVHYHETIHLTRVAKEVNVSVSTISHLFLKEVGVSYSTYVNWLRISQACTLLRQTSLNMTQIAFETGFSSLRCFNRVFSGFFGIPATKYRKLDKK